MQGAELDEAVLLLLTPSSGSGAVARQRRLCQDLDVDSLVLLEVVLLVEEFVGHEISFEFAATWQTVGDVLDWAHASA